MKELFQNLPRLNCTIILIQHMPKFINESLRESLDEVCGQTVRIAGQGEILKHGEMFIAPSEFHLRLINNQKIELFRGDKRNYVCPSVDITLLSVEKRPSDRIMGIILTGMGRDGAAGIVHLKEIGGVTIAQDEKSSVIFGMPKEAIATGQIDWVLNPDQIRNRMIADFGYSNQK